MIQFRSALLLACSAAAISSGASAQTGPEDTRLEEIVVTAQRRSENLQDVPIAVAAVTAATASRLGITDPTAVAQIVPGFQLSRQANTATPFIRGVGTNSGFIGNEPSVASFVDEVYTPSGATAAFEFNNIESIEVLKGPQGTLFGRNATGGVVHVRTKDPTHTPTFDVAATYGSYEFKQAQFYGSAGLNDMMAANVALYGSKQSKGWGRNIFNNREVFRSEGFGGRAKLLVEPSDTTSFLLSAAYDARISPQGVSYRIGLNQFGQGGFSPDRAGAGYYDSTSNFDGGYKNIFWLTSAKVRQELEAVDIVSITAFTNLSSKAQIDTDATQNPVVNALTDQEQKTFTQELQVVSNSDGKLSWILGGFYLFDKANFRPIFFGNAFGPLQQLPVTYQTTSSISGFAQSTFEFLPRTRLTLGLRYTSDQRKFDGALTLGALRAGPFHDQRTFSNLTGRAAIDHRLTDDVMVYVAYNRGFKSGVYNLPSLTPTSTAAPQPVLPEDLNAYSAGFKSEFWDRRVRLNGEAWFYDYKNIQVVNQIVGAQLLTNAGAARIKGFDVDLTVLPVENLTITAAVSVADGHYTRFPNGPTFFPLPPNAPLANRPPSCVLANGQALPPTAYPVGGPGAPEVQVACDLKGNKTVQTIPFAMNLSVLYRIPTAVGDFDAAVSWAHSGDFYWEPDNGAASRQPKTDVINASLQWTAPGDGFAVRIWGRNLGQEKYPIYAQNNAASNARYSPAPPRTYGVTLSAHY